jgi:hypothetical protein
MGIFLDNYAKYLPLGWHIFPLTPGSKVPLRGTAGFHDATADRLANEALAREYPNANIALRCGKESDVIVIDFDPRAGSDQTVRGLRDKSKTFPFTVTSMTPRGGQHLYYAYDPRVATSGANKLGQGVDVKSNGNYIVLPPSYWSEAGTGYKWVFGPKGPRLPKLPVWAVEMLTPKPRCAESFRRFQPGTVDERRLQSAVFAIPPEDREIWRDVGMALKDHLGEAGRRLWNDWSRRCAAKFDERDQEQQWRSFKREGITVATIFHYAVKNGWRHGGN